MTSSRKYSRQVDSSHYQAGYNHLERFISYHNQIKFIENNLNKHKKNLILEVGVGSKFIEKLF